MEVIMKRFSMLLFILCLLGCSSKNQTNSSKKQQLMAHIQTVMPSEIYNELEENGLLFKTNHTFSISNAEENPTLRLDFTYINDKLAQYVIKEYGFTDNMKDQLINEDQAKSLAQLFAKTFLNEDVTLQKVNHLSDYETENYITLEDTNKNIYLVRLDKNTLIKYIDHNQPYTLV